MLTDRPSTKGLQLCYAAVPLLISFIISITAFFAAVFIRGFYYHTNISEEAAADDGIVYLINYMLQIIIFGFWYITQRKQQEELSSENETEKIKKASADKRQAKAAKETSEDKGPAKAANKTSLIKADSNVGKDRKTVTKAWNPVAYWAKRLPLLIVLGFALQFAVSGIIAVLSAAFPSAFSAYRELIQSLAGNDVDWLTFIAVSFLAPIGEELCFRGVTLNYARKGLPIKWAILFQAVLFGIYHLNVVQFFYAVIVGYLLGMLADQAGSVVPSIVLHMIINISAYLIPSVFLDNIPKAAFTAALAIAIAVPCCILLLKKPKKR